MRVLYFSQDYTPHDHRFLSALGETDHDMYFMRLEDRGHELESRPIPEGVSVIDWWGGRRALRKSDWPRALFSLRRTVDALKPDLIHAGPIQSCAFLSSLAGSSPLVSMSWGFDLLLNTKSFLGERSARYTLQRSDALICDCETLRQKAISLGMNAERTVVFPWGVDLDHFTNDGDRSPRTELGWEDAFVVLSTRSWEKMYGIDILLKGLAQAARERAELRILLLGSGSWQDRIEDWARSENLEDRVHRPGIVAYEDLPRYYQAADLYLSASRVDGSSISLLEAMACGRPSLVSDIAGNREWVQEGVNGWLFEDGNARSLAQKLISIAQLDNERDDAGRKARRIAEARANWKINALKLQDAYSLALEGADR